MELCYRNNPDSLFRKYSFLLSYLCGHQVFRDYFSKFGFVLNKKTQLLLPNGFVDYDRGVFKSTFSTRAYNAYKLYLTLQKLDIALPYITDIFDAQKFVLNDLGLIRRQFDLPQIYLTTSTFYPDPHTENTSVDGTVYRGDGSDQTFTALRDGVGSVANDTGGTNSVINYISTTTTSARFDYMYRAFFLFDTSSIDDGDTVSSATFSLYMTNKSDVFSQSVAIIATNPASNTGLATSDYEGCTQTTRQATDITIAAITTSAYNDFALNATGIANISLTSISKFGVKTSADIDNAEPTWSSDVTGSCNGDMADTAGTTTDPKLVVIHAPSTAVKDLISSGFIAFPR